MAHKPTLLEIAKEQRVRSYRRQPFTTEQLELAQAWLDDEVGVSQVARALGKKINNTVHAYVFLARAIKEIYRRGNGQ